MGVLIALALAATACVNDAATPNNRAGEAATPATTIAPEAAAQGPDEDDPIVTVLSSPPDMITGGDALIRIENAGSDVSIRLNGVDESAAFAMTDSGALEGVVTDLALGANRLAVTSDGLTFATSLTNHARRGPVFSGAQAEPLVCTTEAHGLGPAVDRFCSAPTEVYWTYVAADGTLTRLDGSPADVTPATTEIDGEAVDLFIRNEVGTINRGVYWLHTLDPDPQIDGIDRAWMGADVWNQNLVMKFGAGCNASFSQGSAEPLDFPDPELGGPVDLDLIRAGYAVATSTFTSFGTHCNDVVGAETTMMVKERFIEGYGMPATTIGVGASGGSMLGLLVAQNYPGLIDALVAALPFPDLVTVAPGVLDCELLNRYYTTEGGQAFTAEQRAAVNGHLSATTCLQWEDTFGPTFDPSAGCHPSLAFEVYLPEQNPTGIRCTPWDAAPQLFAGDGARVSAPFDNAGVQYGLEALQNRTITMAEFLDLNDEIGGRTIDGDARPQRSTANQAQIERMYRDGRVNQAGGDLRRIPIVLIDLYADITGDVHDRFRSFTIRERIGGGASTPAPNIALWTVQTAATNIFEFNSYLSGEGGDLLDDLTFDAVDAVARWAFDATADTGAPGVALARTRPDDADDRCVLVTGNVITGPAVNQPGGACGDLAVGGDPRTVAGADVESLVLKCSRRDIDLADYPGQLSTNVVRRLERIFPDGVCDFDRPGVAQTRLGDPYVDYSS